MALLMQTQQLTQHRAIDPQILGNFVQETCAVGIQNALKVRETADPGHFYDCHFDRLVRDYLAELRRIYDKFGFVWTEDFEREARAYLAAHPSTGGAKPRLGDFGLTEEGVEAAFAAYLQRYSGDRRS
jgi:hypothetical protein